MSTQSRREYKHYQRDAEKRLQHMFSTEESKLETPSRKGRNARIRAMKRDKKRVEEFKQRALR